MIFKIKKYKNKELNKEKIIRVFKAGMLMQNGQTLLI